MLSPRIDPFQRNQGDQFLKAQPDHNSCSAIWAEGFLTSLMLAMELRTQVNNALESENVQTPRGA